MRVDFKIIKKTQIIVQNTSTYIQDSENRIQK